MTRRDIARAASRREATPAHAVTAVAGALWWQRRAPYAVGLPILALVAAGAVAGVLGRHPLAGLGIVGLVAMPIATTLRARALRNAAPNYPLAVEHGEDQAGPVVVRQRGAEIALGLAYEAAVLGLFGYWLWFTFRADADPWVRTPYGWLVRVFLVFMVLQIAVGFGKRLRRPWRAVLDERGVTTGRTTLAWADVRRVDVEAAGQQLMMRWTREGGEVSVPVFDPAPAIRYTRARLTD